MNGVCLEETAGSRSFIEKTRGIKGKVGKGVDDNNRRFGSIIRVPRARPNSLTWGETSASKRA